MAGIQTIVANIAQGAKASADKIVLDATTEAQGVLEASKATAAETLKTERERLSRDEELFRQRTQSKCDMIVGQYKLKNRLSLVNDVIDRARHELESLPADQYFSMLSDLLGRHALPEDGEMLLSRGDFDRMPQGFEAQVRSMAQGLGGSLRVGESDQVPGAGFVLRYGLIDINCTIDALFAEHADDIRDRVAELLFQE